MAYSEWKIARIFLWWGGFVACLIALFQGSGSLTKFGTVGLVVCGSLAALFAAMELGWHRAPYGIGTPIRLILLIVILFFPLSLLGYFVWPREPSTLPSTSPSAPFSIAAETILPTCLLNKNPDVPSWDCPIWMASQMTVPGQPAVLTKYPVNALVYFRVVNQQPNAVDISEVTVEIRSSKGWQKVIYLDGRLFWVLKGNFKKACEFHANMLDAELKGRAIGPKETVRGWLALFVPRIDSASLASEFRFSISDTLGGRTVVETGQVPVGNFSNASIQIQQPYWKDDISTYRTVLIQDIRDYWQNSDDAASMRQP